MWISGTHLSYAIRSQIRAHCTEDPHEITDLSLIFSGTSSAKENGIMKSMPFIAAAAIALVTTSCEKTKQAGDTSFARKTFLELARGDTAAQSRIDWPTFVAMGQNVGAAYTQLQSETEKQDFRNAFVTQFSTNFRENGGSVDKFTDWRVTFHDSLRTEVAADSPGGVLKITVSQRDSADHVSSIDIVK